MPGLLLHQELRTLPLSAGLDVPIVNNYGVWLDEFKALGLEHTRESLPPGDNPKRGCSARLFSEM